MSKPLTLRKHDLAAIAYRGVVLGLALTLASFAQPAGAQTSEAPAPVADAADVDVQTLTERLRTADATEAKKIERDIRRSWSRSGSASADLLLKRGRDALRAKKLDAAIEHLTALTDHAPEFAEGWHLRASAYFQAELYGPAIEDLAQTLVLNPDHFEAIQGLGAIFGQLGDRQRAYDAYSQVLTIHPHHAGVIEAMERLAPVVMGPKL
jgi:tetratricopeptide (TPR) repeat protein